LKCLRKMIAIYQKTEADMLSYKTYLRYQRTKS